ncbi:OmpH family outer membrane protein [Selenomonas bovis]|uniref:OmpH family outer membrane protein n=1 Tax=Selenomonas bovis TaxID=416586 RepID=A0A848BCH9_9FIRM|nr:OmpH family outer membrane protein [Selenomonas bovis]MBQ1622552.1 OmpH family outer membrane protein [Selenomonas sp.]MCI6171127.1 OmpH family outer membrane protein [Selenomonas bovis]MCI7056056.1 OmpH family outer membrane protein [Selenomonas bovis]NMD98761.1 OmpH family outer membrane protein [Selenomonas bovis]
MKLTKKSRALLLIGVAAMLVMSGCGKAKIGYIDGDRIMKEAPQIQSLVEEGNAKIQQAQEDAEKDLAEKKGTMSDEDFQKAQADARRKVAGLNQSYSVQLKQKLDAALADIAKEKKLDAVVDNQAQQKVVIEGGIDVTDDAINKLQ